MEKISAVVMKKIEARPTQTILKHTNDHTLREYNSIPSVTGENIPPLPKIFDGRIVWKTMLNPPLDQGKCGSCWAFCTTGCLSDRLGIQSRGMINVQLSPTKLILCDWSGRELDMDTQGDTTLLNVKALKETSCYGNTLFDAFRYLYIIGAPTEQCLPYSTSLRSTMEYRDIGDFNKVSQLPLCKSVSGPLEDMCSDYVYNKKTGIEEGTPQRLYKFYTIYTIPGIPEHGGSMENMQYNIYKWGPICTGMDVYSDFYTFDAKNEIYNHTKKNDTVIGGHGVEIVGWGENSAGVKYWIVKNSWGTEWGDGGYFKIIRGVNNCRIEENCMAGTPDFFYPANYIHPTQPRVHMNTEIYKDRLRVADLYGTPAGGIDPETGYTRRIKALYPWKDFSRPVPLIDLPDWDNYVAAIDSEYKPTKNNYTAIYIIIACIIIFLIVVMVIL